MEGNALSPRGLGFELCMVRREHRRICVQLCTLVNMLGEEAMVELRAKPQLQERVVQLQCKRRRCPEVR